jgi:hypothetical protein
MMSDRRKKRAHAPLLALEYFLDAERARSGAAAVGLFHGGEALATSATDVVARRELAATMAGGSTQRDLYVLPLSVGGRRVTLASLDRRVRSMRSVEHSVGRILGGSVTG